MNDVWLHLPIIQGYAHFTSTISMHWCLH